jgi:hypothetical protein
MNFPGSSAGRSRNISKPHGLKARSGFAVKRLGMAALSAVFLLCGCVPAATVARMEGFDAQWRGFEALPPDPTLHYEKDITVKVIVTGDPEAIRRGAIANYSHPDGVIRIRGKRVNGKIVVCPACVGHEFMHALQFQDDNFVNPDQLEKYGY